MSVRITNLELYRNALSDVARLRERLARTQERAASGRRINRPSDDPVGARVASELRTARAAVNQLQRNLDQGQARLRSAESAIADAVDTLIRARELAVQGANQGTLDAAGRSALAAEVAALHDRLLAAANARYEDGYLFAGYANDQAPFTVSGSFQPGSPPPTVSFVGDPSEVQIEIDPGVTAPVTLDGRRAFLGDGDGDGNPDAGRENVFQVLEDLWSALDRGDPAAVSGVLPRLDRALEQLNLERVQVGAADSRIEAARSVHADQQLELEQQLSQVQDADLAQVLSDLVNQETALRASLDATARLMQPSLLDFLR